METDRSADDTVTDGQGVKHVAGSVDLGVAMPSEPVVVGSRLIVGGSSGKIEDIGINLGTPARKGVFPGGR